MKMDSKATIIFLSSILIIIIGFSYYLLLDSQMKEALFDAQTSKYNQFSEKSDMETLEAEVTETDFTDIDMELSSIESELE